MTATPKKMYLSLQAEEIPSQYDRSIQNSADIILLLNADAVITYASPSITHILGYIPEELVGSQVFSLIHPSHCQTMQRLLSEIKQIPGKGLSAECRLRCKDGSWCWFEGSGTNLLHMPGSGAIIANFRAMSSQNQAHHSHLHEENDEHIVQFYETNDFLLDAVSSFIGAGLDTGDACIVVITRFHRAGLEERLKAKGYDISAARLRGEYILLDSAETLSKFMIDGMPEPERFAKVIGSIIKQMTKGQRHVRIFGNMVAQLWTEGNAAAAIRLEELWNDLYNTTSPFLLFCAYSMDNFSGDAYRTQFIEICKQHSSVIPDENYMVLKSSGEQLRAVALLQQKAASLEAEIAERKLAEEKMLYLFNSNLIGVFISDFAGTFLEANDAFLDMVGYTREELLAGAIQRDTLSPAEYHSLSQRAVQALHETGSSQMYEKEYLHKSGKRIPIIIAVTRIGQSETCIGFALDISERKEFDKRKDEFISMASHELKTPVTSLKGFLSLLQRRLSSQTQEKELYYLTRMDSQINKLIKLINDLLDLSKMQTGKLAYREERFALDGLLQEIMENVQETTQTHRLQLEGEAQVEVFGDCDRIGQVLINLLNNAIKYSPHADTVLVRVAKDEKNVHISVQDFGIGIAQEHQSKIFERFYQVTDPEEKTYPGLGIGLYISHEIVKRHNGQMWVESEKGNGTTFHVTLPLISKRA